MAIFYNHIKGCGYGATGEIANYEEQENGSFLTRECWGWIKWPVAIYKNGDQENDPIIKTMESSPRIYIDESNNSQYSEDEYSATKGTCLGHIITSEASYQSIAEFFTLNKGMKVNFSDRFLQTTMQKNAELIGYTLETNSDLWLSNSSLILAYNTIAEGVVNDYAKPFANLFFVESEEGAFINESDDKKKNVLKIVANGGKNSNKGGQTLFQAWRHTFDGHTWIQNSLYVGKDNESEDSNLAEGTIKATNKCEALYFNATSDRRAKNNITPAEFSALHVVNSIPTYTFNYNNKEEKTLGLIAQEAAEFNLDGFNMVDNLEATGQDGDFMQMKESKLVYILWKAVQELSAEVEELKAEIRNLK